MVIASFKMSKYLITLFGSRPQLAAMTTFGSACSIRVHNSLAAKPNQSIIITTTITKTRANSGITLHFIFDFENKQNNKIRIKKFIFLCAFPVKIVRLIQLNFSFVDFCCCWVFFLVYLFICYRRRGRSFKRVRPLNCIHTSPPPPLLEN